MGFCKSKLQLFGLTVVVTLVLICCSILIIPDRSLHQRAPGKPIDSFNKNSLLPSVLRNSSQITEQMYEYVEKVVRVHDNNADNNANINISSFANSSGYDNNSNVDLSSTSQDTPVDNVSSNRTEVRHISFLKVHKAASTTVQTVLFRFGYHRNLSFVLPVKGHYFSKSSIKHEPLLPPNVGNHYDILCIHGYFNYSVYSSVMSNDSVYIAVVREPTRQFISSYYYYATVYKWKSLTDNPIEKIIEFPKQHETSYPLSYTMNSMAKDFGFQKEHFYGYTPGSNHSSAHTHLETLGGIFDLVLVAEYLDESLILMKRLLNWTLKDVLYISKNVRVPEKEVGEKYTEMLRERNKLDYLVYEYFLKKFKRKMELESDDLFAETIYFKRVLIRVQHWCDNQYFGKFTVESSKWNKEFIVGSHDCSIMAEKEFNFVQKLKKIVIAQTQDNATRS